MSEYASRRIGRHSGRIREIKDTDPVCGMTTTPDHTFTRYELDGTPYFFCSSHCLVKFKSDPGRFLIKNSGKASDPSQAKPLLGRPFTCPHHPQILQDDPGRCFLCGHPLEQMPSFS